MRCLKRDLNIFGYMRLYTHMLLYCLVYILIRILGGLKFFVFFILYMYFCVTSFGTHDGIVERGLKDVLYFLFVLKKKVCSSHLNCEFDA